MRCGRMWRRPKLPHSSARTLAETLLRWRAPLLRYIPNAICSAYAERSAVILIQHVRLMGLCWAQVVAEKAAEDAAGDSQDPEEPPVDWLITMLLFFFPAVGGLLFGAGASSRAHDSLSLS